MKNNKWIGELITGLLLVLLCVSTGYAAIPDTINYQGYLTDSDGVPVNGPITMVVSLYDVSTGGTALWSESQNVSVSNGIYSVILGTGTPILGTLGNLTFDKQYYLGIKAGNDPEMTPRQPLTSVGYAFTADTALHVANNGINSAMIQDGSVSSVDVNFNYAGSTLKGGPATDLACTGCVSLTDVDTAAIQRRVSGTCASGSSIREIKQDGTVTCETDDVGSGVPPGFMILGDSSTAPAGYTYTGKALGMPGSWAAKANMPTARASLTAAVVNNKIYAIGGGDLKTTEEYDPVTNSWDTKANMPTARSGLTAAAVNNKIYAIGGIFGSGVLQTNEEYNPVTNSWDTKANMPTARGCLAAAVANNKIYVLGNCNGRPGLTTNEEYDPVANAWTGKAPMPTGREWLAAAAVNNRVYAIGGNVGSAGSGVFSTNEEYDPITNTWTGKASMHTAREAIAAAVVNNKVYVIGGLAGPTTTVGNNEEYDPVTNAWTDRAGMPTARLLYAVAAVNNGVYVIGGTTFSQALAVNEVFTPELLYIHKKD